MQQLKGWGYPEPGPLTDGRGAFPAAAQFEVLQQAGFDHEQLADELHLPTAVLREVLEAGSDSGRASPSAELPLTGQGVGQVVGGSSPGTPPGPGRGGLGSGGLLSGGRWGGRSWTSRVHGGRGVGGHVVRDGEGDVFEGLGRVVGGIGEFGRERGDRRDRGQDDVVRR